MTDEYRAKAAECATLADHARNSAMKEVYRDVARMWLHQAEQADCGPQAENWPSRRPRNYTGPRGLQRTGSIGALPHCTNSTAI
jgi:hypothetical protein